MEIDDKIYREMAEILKPKSFGTYQGYIFTKTEVKLLCIEAALFVMNHHGEDKIDINDFFKQVGL